MLFATFQPLKNDYRSKYNRDTKQLLNFCNKPIFAIGYEGDITDFVIQAMYANPSRPEKLIIFETEKYTKINKIRWHNYYCHTTDLLFDVVVGKKTILDSKTFNITKCDKGSSYEYIVSENDMNIIYELNLYDCHGKPICHILDKESKNSKIANLQNVIEYYLKRYPEGKHIIDDDIKFYNRIATAIYNDEYKETYKMRLIHWYFVWMIFPYIASYVTNSEMFIQVYNYALPKNWWKEKECDYENIAYLFEYLQSRYTQIIRVEEKYDETKKDIKEQIQNSIKEYNMLCKETKNYIYQINQ